MGVKICQKKGNRSNVGYQNDLGWNENEKEGTGMGTLGIISVHVYPELLTGTMYAYVERGTWWD